MVEVKQKFNYTIKTQQCESQIDLSSGEWAGKRLSAGRESEWTNCNAIWIKMRSIVLSQHRIQSDSIKTAREKYLMGKFSVWRKIQLIYKINASVFMYGVGGVLH